MGFLNNNIEAMNKAFKKASYIYKQIPGLKVKGPYGIFINIPFCDTICSFCPYYKEKYKPEDLNRYVPLLIKEILDSDIQGTPKWIYIGGGTPNLLSLSQLERIINALKEKVTITNLGIEVQPYKFDLDYVNGLKNLGFKKLSLGIETLVAPMKIYGYKHQHLSSSDLFQIIHHAQEIGLFVNIDMMLGLQGQSEPIFMEDLSLLVKSEPHQITIYPFLVANGMEIEASLSDQHQYELIEKAARYLHNKGYYRKGPWYFTYATGDLYDSSKDELIDNYIGFGAGSLTSFHEWRIVNPAFQKYSYNIMKNVKMGLVTSNTKAMEDWKKFGRMISELHLKTSPAFSSYLNMAILFMQMNGYSKDGKLTEKGIFYAHHFLKAITENLSFPFPKPSKIANYQSYIAEPQ